MRSPPGHWPRPSPGRLQPSRVPPQLPPASRTPISIRRACLRTLAAGDRNAVITQPSSAVAAPASSMAVASAVVTTAATTRGSRSAAPACAARAIALLRPRQGSPAVRTAEVPPERPPVQDQGIREWVAAEATSLDAYATTAASVPQTPAAATFLAGAKIPVRSGAWCGRQGWVEATVK